MEDLNCGCRICGKCAQNLKDASSCYCCSHKKKIEKKSQSISTNSLKNSDTGEDRLTSTQNARVATEHDYLIKCMICLKELNKEIEGKIEKIVNHKSFKIKGNSMNHLICEDCMNNHKDEIDKKISLDCKLCNKKEVIIKNSTVSCKCNIY